MFGPLFNNGTQENVYNTDVKQSLWINTAQVLTIGATSVASNAVASNTNRVVLSTTQDCWVAVGSDPTATKATAGSFFLSAGSQSYPISVQNGVTKIAAVYDSAVGYLSIIESQ
jgi:hypothetical protein